jgi:hypothetical protein
MDQGWFAGSSYLLSRGGLGDSQAHAEDGVGAELGLVGGAIELDEELVDLGLVLDIDVLLDQGRADDRVDVLNGLGDTLATPLGRVAIAELASLVLTCPTAFISKVVGAVVSGQESIPVEAPEGTMAR